MSNTTEIIKDRLPIDEVVSSYIKLEKSGKNLRAKCPFHNEKTPSFFVSPDRGTYYCFGCGAKGDIFTFVEDYEGIDFRGALKLLADRAGVKIEKTDPQKIDYRQRQFQILEEAALFFQSNLEANGEAKKYLQNRGVDEDLVKTFRLGFAKDDWRNLKTHLVEKKDYKLDEVINSGLLVKNEDGKVYDRFRGRIIFPLFDTAGRIIAFTGRAYPDNSEEKSAKYLNSPETELFRKHSFLYGYNFAKTSMRKNNFAIVVEGQMDLIASFSAGYRNTVATSGTSLTGDHFELIKRMTPNVVLAMDADEAGIASAGKGAKKALALGMDVKVTSLPRGKDPADLILEDKGKWKKTIKDAKHIVDFTLDTIDSKDLEERKRKKEITSQVLPFVKAIENRVDQAHFVKKVAEALNSREDVVYDELGKVELGDFETTGKDKKGNKAKKGRGLDVSQRAIERLQALLIWQEEEGLDDFERGDIEGQLEDVGGLPKVSKEEREELFFAGKMLYEDNDGVGDEVRELTDTVKEEAIKKEMSKVVSKLREAEDSSDDEGAEKYLRQYQDLLGKISKLKEEK